MDERDREVDVGGVGEAKGKRVEIVDGDDRGVVDFMGHGDGLDEVEDAHEEDNHE